jgi:transposase-like protein
MPDDLDVRWWKKLDGFDWATAPVQSRRNAVAAKRFFRKLLKNLEYVPRVIVTDKLGSYQVAHRELLASVEHRRAKYLNNRISRTRINPPGSGNGR